MAGQFNNMGGGAMNQNGSYMLQNQTVGAPFGSPSGNMGFTQQPDTVGFGPASGGATGAFPTHSGFPMSSVSFASQQQQQAGGFPPPAYSQSVNAGQFPLPAAASSYGGSASFGAASPVYAQSAAAQMRPQMTTSPLGQFGGGAQMRPQMVASPAAGSQYSGGAGAAGQPGQQQVRAQMSPSGAQFVPSQQRAQMSLSPAAVGGGVQQGGVSFQQQQQRYQQPGSFGSQQPGQSVGAASFPSPVHGFPSPQSQQQQQFSQQQQQFSQQQQQFFMQQQQQQMMNAGSVVSSAGQSVGMTQQQQVSSGTATPPQPQLSTAAVSTAGGVGTHTAAAGAVSVPSQQTQQQPREYNAATLCRYGQEYLQDLVSRCQELFNQLRLLQPPNGTAQGANISADKQSKIKQQLDCIKMLFKRLRYIHDRVLESCAGIEFDTPESLIPYSDDAEAKLEANKQSELYKQAVEEQNEVKEQVQVRNRYLKDIIDQLRTVVWDVNTMLAMRGSN